MDGIGIDIYEPVRCGHFFSITNYLFANTLLHATIYVTFKLYYIELIDQHSHTIETFKNNPNHKAA